MSKDYQEALDNITPIDDEGWGYDIKEDIEILQECINELAKYKALEQELNCPLDTYVKMIYSIIRNRRDIGTQTVYYLNEGKLQEIKVSLCIVIENKKVEGTHWYINDDNIRTYYAVDFPFNQFGKTWWLDKPEEE